MGFGQPLSMKLKNVHLPHPHPNGGFSLAGGLLQLLNPFWWVCSSSDLGLGCEFFVFSSWVATFWASAVEVYRHNAQLNGFRIGTCKPLTDEPVLKHHQTPPNLTLFGYDAVYTSRSYYRGPRIFHLELRLCGYYSRAASNQRNMVCIIL